MDGKSTNLHDFAGRPVLVNLWATWCGPCVAELPTLAAQAERSKGKIAVIAVAQDDAAKVKPFLAGKKLDALPIYLDPKLGLSVHYKANLPTTILYGANGKEIWRVTGASNGSARRRTSCSPKRCKPGAAHEKSRPACTGRDRWGKAVGMGAALRPPLFALELRRQADEHRPADRVVHARIGVTVAERGQQAGLDQRRILIQQVVDAGA